jgi:hypothetical protein
MRTPEFRISFGKIRELREKHGVNLLAPIAKESIADPEFYHSILSCVLGEEEATKYEESHTFDQIVRDIFQPTKALPGEPEYEETGGAVTETEAPKSGG